MINFLAQIKLFENNGIRGYGPLGLENKFGSDSPEMFNKVITTTIGVLTIVAFIWFLFLLITGAIGIMTSGGDKGGAENARKKITSGLIGLVIVVISIFILDIIGYVFGIDFLKVANWVQSL